MNAKSVAMAFRVPINIAKCVVCWGCAACAKPTSKDRTRVQLPRYTYSFVVFGAV